MLRVPAPARHTQFSFRTGSPQGLLPLHAAERWESATDAHGSGDLTDEQKGLVTIKNVRSDLIFRCRVSVLNERGSAMHI